MKKVKVLQFPMANTKDGVTQYALENWRFIDKSRFQFDFATLSKERLDFEDRMTSQGCKIHYISCHAEIDKEQFIREMHKILDESYDAIHIHTTSWKSFLVEQIAKERKVPVIIVHSHNTMVLNENEDERKQALKIHEKQKELFSTDLATHFCTCSRLATDWLFGEQIPRDTIIHMNNAIDIDLFSYNPSVRQQYRRELGLEDCFVVGHVGRFNYQKNHDLLIEIFKQVCAKVPQARLLMIGTGKLEGSIQEKVCQYGLDNKVVFMGKRDDVNCLMQAMDIFLLPSRFEGLPIVLVEAQASGLKCLTSTLVTDEVALTNNIEFIALDNVKGWVENIVSYSQGYERIKIDQVITDKGYSIQHQIKKLEKLYSNICT